LPLVKKICGFFHTTVGAIPPVGAFKNSAPEAQKDDVCPTQQGTKILVGGI